MGPRNLRRSVQDDILQVLGDGALRGDRLLEAISLLGPRHSVEPFRAVLGRTVPLDCPETEARDTVAAIERHRGGIEALLGRDPGFTVAAFDLLHEMDGTLRHSVFREDESSGAEPASGQEAWAPDLFEGAVRLETRRAERSGRPLAVVVLTPDGDGGIAAGSRAAGFRALRDGARDVDVVGTAPAGDFVVLLPCTGGREGLRAADRFRRLLMGSTGAPFSAGVAAADGRAAGAHDLVRLAGEVLTEARRTEARVALHRPERRAHVRLVVGGAVSARLQSEGVESEIGVEDLSPGGALLATPGRIDPGSEVVLALRGSGARPTGFLIPSRVLRVADGPTPGQPPWRAAVAFRPEARIRIASLLAGVDAPGTRRAP